MDRKKRSTVFGAALIILLAVAAFQLRSGGRDWQGPLLRLPQGGFLKPTQPTLEPEQTVPAGPADGACPEAVLFTPEDGEKITMQYGDGCHYRPNVTQLLLQPLDWDLSVQEPTILILHTHASESYTKLPGQDYIQTTQYRTLDKAYNMVAVGDLLAKKLEQAGICVIHDRQIHDYPSYNDSYSNSRSAVKEYLQQYPSIRVVLDLHRDALLQADGEQYAPVVKADGQSAARLMLVVGTDASGTVHPAWRENLAVAVKLQVLLEKQVPGLTRPVLLRAQRFNHDLSAGAMIVEVGAAGNTLQEAMNGISYLADALIQLMHGSTTKDSTS